MLSRYNQKTYKIERVDFTMSPESTFDKSGTQVIIHHYSFRFPTRTTTRPDTMRLSMIVTSLSSSTKTEKLVLRLP